MTKRLDDIRTKITEVWMKMGAEKIKSVTLEYGGTGDSGDIYGVQGFEVYEGGPEEFPAHLTRVLDDVGYKALNNHGGVNFNNDGGHGTIHFDAEKKQISVENYHYVTSSEFDATVEFV